MRDRDHFTANHVPYAIGDRVRATLGSDVITGHLAPLLPPLAEEFDYKIVTLRGAAWVTKGWTMERLPALPQDTEGAACFDAFGKVWQFGFGPLVGFSLSWRCPETDLIYGTNIDLDTHRGPLTLIPAPQR